MNNYEAIKQAAKQGANLTDLFSRSQILDAFKKASVIWNMAEIYNGTAPDWALRLKQAWMEVRGVHNSGNDAREVEGCSD